MQMLSRLRVLMLCNILFYLLVSGTLLMQMLSGFMLKSAANEGGCLHEEVSHY